MNRITMVRHPSGLAVPIERGRFAVRLPDGRHAKVTVEDCDPRDGAVVHVETAESLDCVVAPTTVQVRARPT